MSNIESDSLRIRRRDFIVSPLRVLQGVGILAVTAVNLACDPESDRKKNFITGYFDQGSDETLKLNYGFWESFTIPGPRQAKYSADDDGVYYMRLMLAPDYKEKLKYQNPEVFLKRGRDGKILSGGNVFVGRAGDKFFEGPNNNTMVYFTIREHPLGLNLFEFPNSDDFFSVLVTDKLDLEGSYKVKNLKKFTVMYKP